MKRLTCVAALLLAAFMAASTVYAAEVDYGTEHFEDMPCYDIFANSYGTIKFTSYYENLGADQYGMPIQNKYVQITGFDSSMNERWSKQTGVITDFEEHWDAFALCDDHFYYHDCNTIYCIEVSTGTELWQNHDLSIIATTDAFFSDVKVGDNRELYVAEGGGHDSLLVVDPAGNTLFCSGSNYAAFYDSKIQTIEYVAADTTRVVLVSRDGQRKEYTFIANNTGNRDDMVLEPQPYPYVIGNNNTNSNSNYPGYAPAETDIKSNYGAEFAPTGTAINNGYGPTGNSGGLERSDLVGTGTARSYGFSDTAVLYSISGEINMRAWPSHNSGLVRTVYGSTPMYFYGGVDTGYGSDGMLHTWYQVHLNDGTTGWVRSDLVTMNGSYNIWAPGSVFYSINGELNLRSQPTHNSALVTTIYGGTPMYFYGETGHGYGSDNQLHMWYLVSLNNGIRGWVRSDLIW